MSGLPVPAADSSTGPRAGRPRLASAPAGVRAVAGDLRRPPLPVAVPVAGRGWRDGHLPTDAESPGLRAMQLEQTRYALNWLEARLT